MGDHVISGSPAFRADLEGSRNRAIIEGVVNSLMSIVCQGASANSHYGRISDCTCSELMGLCGGMEIHLFFADGSIEIRWR